MTLVAYHGFQRGAAPLFVTDVVVSGEGKKQGAPVPTGAGLDAEASRFVARLGQKLAIITPNIVVGCTGSSIDAAVFCRALKERSADGSLTPLNFDTVVPDTFRELVREGDVKELAAFASCVMPGAAGTQVSHLYLSFPEGPMESCSPSGFEDVVALGSGAKSYLRLVGSRRVDPNPPAAVPAGATASKAFLHLMTAMGPVARLLAKEVNSKRGNLNEYWGGWYEVATFVDGRFRKLGNVLYLVLETRLEAERSSICVRRLFKTAYVGEHLYVRALELEPLTDSAHKIISDKTHHVPPLIASPPPMQPVIALDDYEVLCVLTNFVGPGGGDDDAVLFAPLLQPISKSDEGWAPPPNAFKEAAGTLDIWCQPEFLDTLKRALWANETAAPKFTGGLYAMQASAYRQSLVAYGKRATVPEGEVLLVLDVRDPLAQQIYERHGDASAESSACPIRGVGLPITQADELISYESSVASGPLPNGFARMCVVAAGGVHWDVRPDTATDGAP